ncbi:MAG: methyltransferase [Anaeromyxobacter sp. RBG_16_69_14]|nr:MAG: methyltransferase [Anaeromyxobacter sp. RBG_16_69_14]
MSRGTSPGRCRACRQPIDAEPLLVYRDMPVSAQAFPTADSVAADRGAELTVIQCPACGLVQLDGPPVPYHREVIRAAAFSTEMRVFRIGQFAAWVGQHGLGGRKVLEVGCGRGEYLELLEQCGTEAHGLEYAPAAEADCRARGLRVARGYVEGPDQRLAQAPFDAFVSLNFMEHWPDPVASLLGISANLADGGLGLVEVPNFDMIAERGLYSEFISDHLSYFTRQTFAATLERGGFQVLDCASVWHDYILSATVKKRQPVDLGLIQRRREEMAGALAAFLDRFPRGRTAIWGAGHQALAVIALAGLANRIRYVVDSAPFKQGKFTPATHLPIVPPTALESDPVSALIVMAAAYSDEVAALIRARHGPELAVAILRDHGLEMR